MKKCPDEKILAEYLDYRLPSKQWQEVRAHCYFCDDCQKIVRIATEAISLRRNRLGLSENEKKNEIPEALRLGILSNSPGNPAFARDAAKLHLKMLREGHLYMDPDMNKKEYEELIAKMKKDESIPSLGLSMERSAE